MNNKLLEFAHEKMEKDKLLDYYYFLIDSGYSTRKAKRYMKKKFNYTVKS